jgi:hypothetical protein
MGLNILRYLSFEVGRTCVLSELHRGKCPISHPDRYKYSQSEIPLSSYNIMEVWQWARSKGFRGIVMWHMYNEPVLELSRIRKLMLEMKKIDPLQPFQLTTSIPPPSISSEFDIFLHSDYHGGAQLDDRILTNTGEGRPYYKMPQKGHCGRGKGWEVIIDYYGNWCLCCNDWQCEELIGNIHNTSLDTLLNVWEDKRQRIMWTNKEEYEKLPRMCRACLDKNPSLAGRGGV